MSKFSLGISSKRVGILNEDGQQDGLEGGFGSDLATAEAKPKLKQPPRYKVIMLNDDFTPMDFVIEVLVSFFYMDSEQATQVMLTVHTQGRAVCGIFTRDVAETKAALVVDFARENEHPLMCNVEVVE